MQRDAHYYAVLAFCRACGFKKESAQVVAYASQFVDDAKINLMLIDQSSLTAGHDMVENRPAFFNMATCHSYFRINTFNYEAMVNNTIAFHFVPGCEGENFTKRLRCKEEAPIILDILKDVFIEDNLIKLGIILHAYADSYTHQGFSGMLSKVNDIDNLEATPKVKLGIFYKILDFFEQFNREKYDKLFDDIMPAYGHGQALEFPDIPYLVWSYDYDESDGFNGSYRKIKIDNKERYKRAFNNIRNHLQNYLIQHNQYLDRTMKFNNFDKLMDTLLLENFKDIQREKNWKKLLIEQGLFSKDDLASIIYDETQWLKEAFSNFDRKVFDNRKVDGVRLADNFVNSHWYHFYQSVKWYKGKFFEYCAKYQLNIPH